MCITLEVSISIIIISKYCSKNQVSFTLQFDSTLNQLRSNLHSIVVSIWRELSSAVGDYVRHNDKKRAHLGELRNLDANGLSEVEDNQRRLNHAEVNLLIICFKHLLYNDFVDSSGYSPSLRQNLYKRILGFCVILTTITYFIWILGVSCKIHFFYVGVNLMLSLLKLYTSTWGFIRTPQAKFLQNIYKYELLDSDLSAT